MSGILYENDMFREIAENSMIGMVIFQDGKVIWVNQQLALISEYTINELIGSDILLDSLVKESRASVVEKMVMRMDGRDVNESFHMRMCSKHKQFKYLEAYASPTEYQGKPALALIVRDISDHIIAERDLKKREQEARDLLELSPDPIIVHRHGIVITANRAAASLAGLPSGCQMSGRTLKEVFAGEINISFWVKIDDYIDQDTDSIPRSEEILVLPDGREVHFEAMSSPVQLGGNNVAITTLRDISERKLVEKERREHTEKLESMLYSTVGALSATLESRDPYTSGHQKRVANLASAIAAEMGLNPRQIDGIHIAGMLHDIGKIIVPAEILSKPGRLYEPEFELIKLHPAKGWEILKGIEFLQPVAEIVRQHHERLDGSGYPQGLSKNDILVESRILAVADVVEAMSSHRPYRPSLGMEIAIKEITGRTDAYDEMVVDACLKVIKDSAFDTKEMVYVP